MNIHKKKIGILILLVFFSNIIQTSQAQNITSNVINYFKTDSLSRYKDLSPEAIDVLARPTERIPKSYTYGDTIFFSYLFLPVIFDNSKIFDSRQYNKEVDQLFDIDILRKHLFEHTSLFQENLECNKPERMNNSLTREMLHTEKILKYVYINRPNLVELTVDMLPEKVTYDRVATPQYKGDLAVISNTKESIAGSKVKTINVDPKYWIFLYESTIQFSQYHISKNWHKGGNNSLNIFMRNYLNLTYSKDRIKWENELESKFGITNAANDTVNKYQITDDLLRLHSNIGLKASKNWFYTFDAELRTQFFNNKKINSHDLITSFLSPVAIDAGIGMKYELNKKFASDKFKKLHFSANIAPFAFSYLYTYKDDIDKDRLGFNANQRDRFSFGSSLKASLNFDISQTINWKSRLFYNTSYDRIESEWENTISISLTRYFSTMLNLHLRYDDAVRGTSGSFKDLLQYTELFSFGFNYKLK